VKPIECLTASTRYAAGLVSAFSRCPRWAPGCATCSEHPALRCLTQALKLQPGNIKLMRSRARLLRHLGLYELAAEVYHALVRATPKDYKTLLRRGRVLAKLGRQEQALEDVNEAVRVIQLTFRNAYLPSYSCVHIAWRAT
jgi:tetratricopeptide (TPR) repeat protein